MDAVDAQREREIREGFRRGERWAFDAVARQYIAYIINFIANLLHDRDKAQELAQEAFFLACRAHARFDTKREIGPWLFQIARNLAYKEFNRRKTQMNVSLDETIKDSHAEPETDLTGPRDESALKDLQTRIDRAITRLNPKYRDVLILRMIQTLPGEKVADMLQIPLATVNTRLHRALKQLRRYAQQEGIREDEVFS